jgi:hypothetical protein
MVHFSGFPAGFKAMLYREFVVNVVEGLIFVVSVVIPAILIKKETGSFILYQL